MSAEALADRKVCTNNELYVLSLSAMQRPAFKYSHRPCDLGLSHQKTNLNQVVPP